MDILALLELEDPVLEAKFHVGNPAYKDPRYDQLKPRLNYFVKELTTGAGITKQLLWEEYREAASPAYGYKGHKQRSYRRVVSFYPVRW